jgi:hypothetical protein
MKIALVGFILAQILLGGGKPLTGRRSLMIDVQEYGVIGNGTTDDTTAMQNAVNAVCHAPGLGGRELVAPYGSLIAVSSTIAFNNCSGVHLDFGSGQGETTYNTSGFVWIGANGGGPVISVNRTRDSIFENFFILEGKSRGNQANVALDIDETGAGSNIVTNNKFSDIAIGFIQGAVPANHSFIGIQLGQRAPGNIDGQEFDRIRIQCPGPSPTTTNSNGIGILANGAGGAEPYGTIINNSPVSGCSRGYDIENAADIIDINGGILGRNYTDLYVGNGSGVKYHNIRSEGSLAQIVAHGDVELDNLAFSGLTAGTTTISLSGSGRYILDNLHWDSIAVTPLAYTGTGSISVTNSRFPRSTCPSSALTQGIGVAVMNTNFGTSCDNVLIGTNQSFGVASYFPSVNVSPSWYWGGQYQVSGGVFAQDKWTVQDVVGSGNNGTSTLTFLHSGSSGTTRVSLPAPITLPSVLFANLPSVPDGTLVYCSDCKNVTDDTTGTFDSVAAAGGHGTNVLRENGAWRVH